MQLTTCFVKALYLPDLSTTQLVDAQNRMRSTADISRTILMLPNHVLMIRGTSEQVALAEKLTN